MSDLVQRLTEAATRAIENERGALEGDGAGYVRGLTIELVMTKTGQVHEALAYVERRTAAGALLGRHVKAEQIA